MEQLYYSMQIQEITNTLSKNYSINNITKKTWDMFVNHIYQYKNEHNKLKKYYNKSLMVDFYRKSFEILKNTNIVIGNLSLSDKQLELSIKNYVNQIIDQFLKFNIESMREL